MANIYNLPGEEKSGVVWSMDHFPQRFQFVIFRNWNRIPVERIARVLGTTPEQILCEAARLGLRRYEPECCTAWQERGYLTTIRENWFIINYEQLCELLDFSNDQLYRVLMDEDFMFHKMGNSKPYCPEVKWVELSGEELSATEEIGRFIALVTADEPAEKEFDFLKKLSSVPAKAENVSGRDNGALRMVYSYCAPFGDVLLPGAPDPFPEGLLAQYQASGVNAVWFPVLLSAVTPWTGDLDYSEKWELRLATLQKMAEKLARYDLKLFLYLNEPRCLPAEIAARHPDWIGPHHADGSGMRALCINNDEVAARLRKGVADLCRAVPGIGGFFTITMSENLTHCLSRMQHGECARCDALPDPSQNVVKVLKAIHGGITDASSPARLIAWNWAWQKPWDMQVVENLPPEVEIMCVSETELETDCCGIKGKIIDYSIAHPGPGPLAPRLWKRASELGHKIIAKVQLNASWELSSLPYIPVPHLAKKHLENLAAGGINDFMLSWTLGGSPGGNMSLTDCTVAEWCRRISGEFAGEIERACQYFADGFGLFPFNSTSLIYHGPQNFGSANLLYAEKAFRGSTMVGFPMDNLRGWTGGFHYPVEVLSQTFMQMAAEWKKGLDILQDLVEKLAGNAAFEELYNMADAGYALLQSSANQIEFYRQRDGERNVEIMRSLVENEAEMALQLLRAQQRDSRIGFEASNHYMYGENTLLEKILNCRSLLKNL